ncbi:MAG: hypothetical protein ACW968_12130 [Candidatus Thorarchaeota archaeon]
MELIDASDKALKEDAKESVKIGLGETQGKLYRNQSRFNYPELSAIWRLDESSKRLEKLTIGLCILTIPLVILSIIQILKVIGLIA